MENTKGELDAETKKDLKDLINSGEISVKDAQFYAHYVLGTLSQLGQGNLSPGIIWECVDRVEEALRELSEKKELE